MVGALIGETLDRKYRIVRLLGAGGMGSVYEAEHTGTRERVAVKLIRTEKLGSGSEAESRFRREALAASAIDSPHIVRILDSGADEATGDHYLVMEYLVGEDLRALVDRVGPLPAGVALRIAGQALVGLHAAHQAGIVHRDIKPANLFLARRGGGEIQVTVLDFGIAKIHAGRATIAHTTGLTTTGGFLGSPLYMSPEQVQNSKDVDHRTDLWSLGTALYAALAGRAPHQDVEFPGKLIVNICGTSAPPLQERAPWVTRELAAVVRRALAIDPGQRWPSAAALLAALQARLPEGSPEGFALREEMLCGVGAEERASVVPTVAGGGTPAVGRKRILVVEDDDQIGASIVKSLLGEGFEVELETTGTGVAARVEAGVFDLVVLDLMLPGVSGFDILAELRHRSTTPVIVLTARTELEDRLSCFEQGAVDYVSKPFWDGGAHGAHPGADEHGAERAEAPRRARRGGVRRRRAQRAGGRARAPPHEDRSRCARLPRPPHGPRRVPPPDRRRRPPRRGRRPDRRRAHSPPAPGARRRRGVHPDRVGRRLLLLAGGTGRVMRVGGVRTRILLAGALSAALGVAVMFAVFRARTQTLVLETARTALPRLLDRGALRDCTADPAGFAISGPGSASTWAYGGDLAPTSPTAPALDAVDRKLVAGLGVGEVDVHLHSVYGGGVVVSHVATRGPCQVFGSFFPAAHAVERLFQAGILIGLVVSAIGAIVTWLLAVRPLVRRVAALRRAAGFIGSESSYAPVKAIRGTRPPTTSTSSRTRSTGRTSASAWTRRRWKPSGTSCAATSRTSPTT